MYHPDKDYTVVKNMGVLEDFYYILVILEAEATRLFFHKMKSISFYFTSAFKHLHNQMEQGTINIV